MQLQQAEHNLIKININKQIQALYQ